MSNGALVLVGTPIGNLGDIGARAVEQLAAADVVCCEDTRRTGRLLAHLGVTANRLLRVDEHTEHRTSDEVVELVAAGRRVVLVSDAGMPGLSDPGERLVAAVAGAGLTVTVVPGPSAVITALVASGLGVQRFVFEGFLPRKGAQREARLASIASDRRATAVHESPRRLATTLADLAAVCGSGRRAVVARELTKLHEEYVRGTLAELVEWAVEPAKGEVVVVVEGAPAPPDASDAEILAALEEEIGAGSSTRDAVSAVASALSVGRRRAYVLALGIDEP